MLRLALVFALASALPPALTAQDQEADVSPASLALDADIPWRRDPEEFTDARRAKRNLVAKVDRSAMLEEAIAQAKAEGKPVLWYVYRIVEQSSRGVQMYRAPILDLYMQQVLFADPDVAAMVRTRFVPVRMVCDEPLSARFNLRPLQFVEPAVVFIDGDGKVIHYVERLRTFDALWFGHLLRRVLGKAGSKVADDPARTPAQWLELGEWEKALTTLQATPETTLDKRVVMAGLLRRLLRPSDALELLDQAEPKPAAGARGAGGNPAEAAAVRTERGRVLLLQGRLQEAALQLRDGFAVAHERQAEAGYHWALCRLRLGHESEAARLFGLVAERFAATCWGRRAKANVEAGNDDRPKGAAFANFEHVGYLPDSAYRGDLPRDTVWAGPALDDKALARGAVTFLLESQRDNGGFTDSRYAYWPNTSITPNAWVAIRALAACALADFREVDPARIDAALANAERFLFDPTRLNRGSNEDVYADAYRIMYLVRKLGRSDEAGRAATLTQANALVQEAQARQFEDGFWAHEYKNAFCTGAMLWSLMTAKAAGVTVSDEILSKGAQALLSARYDDGSYVYGGAAKGKPGPMSKKDAAARMPMCEGTLLAMQRSDVTKLSAAFQNYFHYMDRVETVRRNDFHSDGELAGFFYFHGLYHNSETNKLLPEAERKANAAKLRAILLRVPELDGSFVDSHEIGRTYGTAMALLTLANVGE